SLFLVVPPKLPHFFLSFLPLFSLPFLPVFFFVLVREVQVVSIPLHNALLWLILLFRVIFGHVLFLPLISFQILLLLVSFFLILSLASCMRLLVSSVIRSPSSLIFFSLPFLTFMSSSSCLFRCSCCNLAFSFSSSARRFTSFFRISSSRRICCCRKSFSSFAF